MNQNNNKKRFSGDRVHLHYRYINVRRNKSKRISMKSRWNEDTTANGSTGIRSRRQTTIQIRKQRKEELLRRKRGIIVTGSAVASPTQVYTTSASTTAKNPSPIVDHESFRDILTSYCCTPNSVNQAAVTENGTCRGGNQISSQFQSLYTAIVTSTLVGNYGRNYGNLRLFRRITVNLTGTDRKP
jgi:Importin beta binding domain